MRRNNQAADHEIGKLQIGITISPQKKSNYAFGM